MCVRNNIYKSEIISNYDQFYYYHQQFTIEPLYKFMYSIVFLY